MMPVLRPPFNALVNLHLHLEKIMKTSLVWLLTVLMFWISGCASRQAMVDYDASLDIPQSSFPGTENKGSAAIDSNATLSDLRIYAALNNPALKAAYYRWQTAMEKIPQATALPDPQVSYGYFIRQVETRVGPQQHRFGIKQMFPWFGKLRLKGEMAGAMAAAAAAKFHSEREKLVFTIDDAYYEYAYLQRSKEILAENTQLLSFLEGVVRAKYRAGNASYAALMKVQVELDKLHDRRQNLLDMEIPLQTRLNAILNRHPAAPSPRPSEILLATVDISDSSWVDLLLEKNPDLIAGRHQIDRSAANIDLAKKQRLPDFMLGIDYISTGDALSPNALDSGKDPVIAMLSLNIPLWGGKNKARIREAILENQLAENEQRNRENQLKSRLAMVLFKFQEARRKITLYTDALLPRANQALNVARSAFEADEIDFLELIDSQRSLLEIELMLVRAQVNYNQRLAELKMLTAGSVILEGKS